MYKSSENGMGTELMIRIGIWFLEYFSVNQTNATNKYLLELMDVGSVNICTKAVM